jgi:cytochrome c5
MAEPHASPIKTPKQLITVVVLAFVVPIAVIILLVTYVASERSQSPGSRALTPEAVAERLRPVGTVVLAEAGGAKALQPGEAVYKLACVACHGAGVAGAPKTGDAGAWAPRIKLGYETLVKHALEGFKAMPPKGGNAGLDNVEVARAVVYMANESGAKFKEHAAPAGAPATAAAPAPTSAPAAPPAASAPVAAAPAGKADAAAGEKLYQQSCMACHAAGVAGAPKTGDKAAWAPRIKEGVDPLVASVIKGKGAMPPRGASTGTDAEIRAAVEYLVAQAK